MWNRLLTAEVRRHAAELRYHPDTGIWPDCAPRDLGPEDSECAILFIHGFSASPQEFGDLPEKVAASGWRVRALLLPGHAVSPFEFEKKSPEDLLSHARDELLSLRERHARVVVLGHSLGGAIATLLAAETPLDGVILSAPYYQVRHKWYYGLRPEQWTDLLGSAIRWVHANPDRQPVNRKEVRRDIRSHEWVPLNAVRTAMTLAHRAKQPGILRQIHAPVLHIHSRNDNVTSPGVAENAVKAIPSRKKETVWLEKSDHIIFWDYERDEVADAVLRFLDAVRTGEKEGHDA